MKLMEKIGFKEKKQMWAFLTVVMSGQIIYSAFEAFKGTFLLMLTNVLGITNAEMGILFSLIGIAMFFYVPGGWFNNRFMIRDILMTSLAVRFITLMVIIFFAPSFKILAIIATIWGLTDAVFWPAVVNGVGLLSSEKNKGMAFGLLESIRRTAEMGMNLILATLITTIGGAAILAQQGVFKKGMFVYALLILPMIFCVYKFVPENKIAEPTKDESKNKVALKGLIAVFKIPMVWMAALASLTVYWCYINLIYTVPYLQAVFNISTSQAALFGIINTAAMGIVAGLISGIISDFVFKSSIKMMFVSLLATAGTLLAIIMLPKTATMLWPNLGLLLLFSFSIFLAKGIIMAPIAEIKIPDEYRGASMSIGSFAAYASIFWAYALNGRIIDSYPNDPIIAYQKIFMIGMVVALFGAACALVVLMAQKKAKLAEGNGDI